MVQTVNVADTEDAPLLSNGNEGNNAEPAESQRLWEELDKPWPSTFERSISLLASPVIPKTQAAIYTKSPKPGSTLAALARRQRLDRGYYTPEGPSIFQRHRQRSESLSHERPIEDYKLHAFQREQERKAKQAEEYRKKIIQKTNVEKVVTKPPDGKSTFLQCCFNLANILMGVGLLGLPYALKAAGWFGGLFSLACFAFVTWRTSILIGRELNGDPRPSHAFDDSPFKSPYPPGSTPQARMYAPITSFPDIARKSFGDTGSLILSIILYFELFSCIVIFLVTIADHLYTLYPTIPKEVYTSLTGVFSLVPAALLRTPALLSYLSMVGTIATVSVVSAVILEAFTEGDISEQVAESLHLSENEPLHIIWEPSGLALAVGTVAYCFSGHAIVPSIYTSMAKPQEFERMVTITYVFVVVCCLSVGVGGYYMFGSTVLDQVTLSLERSSHAVTLMKCLTWLMILTAFSKITLTLFPLAIGMEEIVAPFLTSDASVDFVSVVVKIFLTMLAVIIAIYVPSFSFMCTLVGMVCTMAISVIFPAAAYLKMFWRKLSVSDKILNTCIVVLGLVLSIIGTIATVRHEINNS